jgi:hypothetical protein
MNDEEMSPLNCMPFPTHAPGVPASAASALAKRNYENIMHTVEGGSLPIQRFSLSAQARKIPLRHSRRRLSFTNWARRR